MKPFQETAGAACVDLFQLQSFKYYTNQLETQGPVTALLCPDAMQRLGWQRKRHVECSIRRFDQTIVTQLCSGVRPLSCGHCDLFTCNRNLNTSVLTRTKDNRLSERQ